MTYVIVNFVDVTEAMVNDCAQYSIATLRHTVSGTDKVILKYSGDDPAWVSSLSLTTYTHAEILTELLNPEWNGSI